MKKLISAILMMAAVSLSVTAFASEDVTYYTDNSVSSSVAAGKSTVLITKGTSTAAFSFVILICLNNKVNVPNNGRNKICIVCQVHKQKINPAYKMFIV